MPPLRVPCQPVYFRNHRCWVNEVGQLLFSEVPFFGLKFRILKGIPSVTLKVEHCPGQPFISLEDGRHCSDTIPTTTPLPYLNLSRSRHFPIQDCEVEALIVDGHERGVFPPRSAGNWSSEGADASNHTPMESPNLRGGGAIKIDAGVNIVSPNCTEHPLLMGEIEVFQHNHTKPKY